MTFVNWIAVGGLWLLSFVPFIPQLASIWSCWETHKVRNGQAIAKSEGKLMAFMMCQVMLSAPQRWLRELWGIPWYFCDMFVEEQDRNLPMPRNAGPRMPSYMIGDQLKWRWNSWSMVSFDYFNNDDHPCVVLMRNWIQDSEDRAIKRGISAATKGIKHVAAEYQDLTDKEKEDLVKCIDKTYDYTFRP